MQKLIKKLKSSYYKIDTNIGTLHIHIDYDKSGPKKIFTQMPPVGSDDANMTAFLGILLTKYFEAGGDPSDIIKHMVSVKGTRIGFWNGSPIESIPQAISIAIKAHLKENPMQEDRKCLANSFAK